MVVLWLIGPASSSYVVRNPTGSRPHFEPRAAGEGGPGLVEDGLDRLLVLGDRRLLQQDDVLEEAVEAPLGDLGDRLLGLALLAGGGLGDLALLGHDVR